MGLPPDGRAAPPARHQPPRCRLVQAAPFPARTAGPHIFPGPSTPHLTQHNFPANRSTTFQQKTRPSLPVDPALGQWRLHSQQDMPGKLTTQTTAVLGPCPGAGTTSSPTGSHSGRGWGRSAPALLGKLLRNFYDSAGDFHCISIIRCQSGLVVPGVRPGPLRSKAQESLPDGNPPGRPYRRHGA